MHNGRRKMTHDDADARLNVRAGVAVARTCHASYPRGAQQKDKASPNVDSRRSRNDPRARAAVIGGEAGAPQIGRSAAVAYDQSSL